jgi:hypothetical protein
VAQFRIEFVLDQASGKYLAEMYHPERGDELLLRTEALYPSQEAAVLGVVQLFRNAVLQFPKKTDKPRVKSARKAKAKSRPSKGAKANPREAAKASKAKRKQAAKAKRKQAKKAKRKQTSKRRR